MKQIIVVALLIVVAVAMPHDHSNLATKKLFRLPKQRLTLGAPVTYEKYGTGNQTDDRCHGERHYGIQLHVGECKQLSDNLAINITDWVQPPIHNKEPEALCASYTHYEGSDCQTNGRFITFETKKCEDGEAFADYSAALPDVLTLHSKCTAASVAAPVCNNCSVTARLAFKGCTNVPAIYSSFGDVRVEKCVPVRLNFLESCAEGSPVTRSYALAQDRCFAGHKILDGHH